MENETIKAIEDKLEKYFKRDDDIRVLNRQINDLIRVNQDINERIDNLNISIPEESSSPQFGERVQTSPSGTSYVEATICNIITRMLMQKVDNEDKISRKLHEIDKLKTEYSAIDERFKMLGEGEDKEGVEILRMRYGKKYSLRQISERLILSESTVCRKRTEMLEKIEGWGNW